MLGCQERNINEPFETETNIWSQSHKIISVKTMGAAKAQWIRLLLRSCCPGFESQAHHLCFYQIVIDL